MHGLIEGRRDIANGHVSMTRYLARAFDVLSCLYALALRFLIPIVWSSKWMMKKRFNV
jgi:hypothetical protein